MSDGRMEDAPKDPVLGRMIGHCVPRRKLGEGGMGTVYLAQHAGLGKPVALKILPESLSRNPDFIARFLREARLAARLEHPNVVQVYDVGQAKEIHYISMQYVEGKSLDVLLKERGRLSPDEGLSIAKRMAAALEAARRLGIVHRDIKPANILISKDGLVKVADFGLAKDRESKGSVSDTGQILGTPHYMAPEQAEGKAVDHRSDVYALGATLYHMLAGQKPFEGPTPISVVVKSIHDRPVPLRKIDPSIPKAVEALVDRLMAKDPDERPATCDEVARAIDAVKAGKPASAIIPPRGRAAMVALPVAGILVLGIVLGLLLGRPAPEPAAAPPSSDTKRPDPFVPPEPPSRKPSILEAIRDVQERRLAEEVMERTEALLEALRGRDLAVLRDLADRLTFGDSGEAPAQELLRRIASEDLDLAGWDFEAVEVRPRSPGRPLQARVTMRRQANVPAGFRRTSPIHWVKRFDGRWYLTRAPRGEDR